MGTGKLRRSNVREAVSAKPGTRACKDAAQCTASLLDGISRRHDGRGFKHTHICFLGVFAWGIKEKMPVINSA